MGKLYNLIVNSIEMEVPVVDVEDDKKIFQYKISNSIVNTMKQHICIA
jgi:hypothetical protein